MVLTARAAASAFPSWRQQCQRLLTLAYDVFEFASALQRLERRRDRNQAAQNDCSRHSDALVVQIELCEGVLTKGNERNAAEVGQCGVLEHHLSQTLGAIAYDAIEANTARP